MVPSDLPTKALARFNANRPKGKPDACWLWCGNTDGNGYGKVFVGGRYVGAHRVAFMLDRGELAIGVHVLHKCDNPPCCNPAHLFAGSAATNIADCISKGRARRIRGNEHPARRIPGFRAGEKNGRARLTEHEVADIRRELMAGVTRAELARRYGVTWPTIDRISTGERWPGVEVDDDE